jgi:hypothetical protein
MSGSGKVQMASFCQIDMSASAGWHADDYRDAKVNIRGFCAYFG